jgi:hypothetical protein
MTTVSHSAIAIWLLARIASKYQRDALIGDLTEEYAQGRSRRWLWVQVFAALRVRGASCLRRSFRVSPGTVLLFACQVTAASALVALIIAWRRSDAPGVLLRLACFTALAMLSSGLVAFRLARGGSFSPLKNGWAVKKLLAAFAVLALSTATLTWAGTATSPSTNAPPPLNPAGNR